MRIKNRRLQMAVKASKSITIVKRSGDISTLLEWTDDLYTCDPKPFGIAREHNNMEEKAI